VTRAPGGVAYALVLTVALALLALTASRRRAGRQTAPLTA
jgi:hypothetical protein